MENNNCLNSLRKLEDELIVICYINQSLFDVVPTLFESNQIIHNEGNSFALELQAIITILHAGDRFTTRSNKIMNISDVIPYDFKFSSRIKLGNSNQEEK
jgi:hypothetical protein